MMNISLAGLIGAIVGTVIAGVNYHLLIGALERAMRERAVPADDGEALERKLSLLRRLVLTVELLFFATLGYWIGMTFWD